jgi:O-methyltransferase
VIQALLLHVQQRSKERRRAKKLRTIVRRLDDDAKDTILRVRDYTMLNPEKIYSFIQAVRYVQRNAIPGAIVECGVWRGGAIMAAALTLRQLGAPDRIFYLYDTFSGMPAPATRDRSLIGKIDPTERFAQTRIGDDASDWCYASLDDVRQNLANVPYDQGKFVLVQGKVEDTLPKNSPGPIAILRLDTDWYESTRHEMEHLMPLLMSKGVLIVGRLLPVGRQPRRRGRVHLSSPDSDPAHQGRPQRERREAMTA